MSEPMSYEDRELLRNLSLYGSPSHVVRGYQALLAEVDRMWDLFEKLAAATGCLDFDRSESCLPQTEEQWIEFVREVHEHTEKIIDQYEEN